MRPILFLLFCLSSQAHEIALDITPEIKAKTEEVINHCEELYLKVVDSRNTLVTRLSKTKKPSFKKYKKEKDKNYLYLKTFDTMFPQFAKATNDKIYVRNATTTKELSGALEAYSSNCIRFGNGLLGFVRWTVGIGPEGYDQIYNEWVEEVLANLIFPMPSNT